MKFIYALLAGIGVYGLCKAMHVATIVPIVILGQSMSLGAILGIVVTWFAFHSMRR